MRILAIDDNQDNLTALQAVVSDRLPEATVLTALNGPDGLDLAHAEDPDVILLDIVMPGIDGYEVCRRLKADPLLQAIPVLFLTANRTDRASRVKALEAGAEGFLSKPFDDLELTAQIRSMVKIKAAVSSQRAENERLAALIAERTRALESELEQRRQAEEELRDGSRRAALQRSAIAHLTSDRQIADGDLDPSLERVAEAMSATVGVARASIWQLSEDELELRCLTLHEADQQTYSSGAILETDVFPRYFEAIMSEGRIYAEDAQSDPRTNELTESYLRPLGIASMLDAGILVKGKLVGVVCLEHIGPRRAWYPDEESFVSTMAALVGQLLVNAERKRAETALQVSEARYRTLVENIPQTIFVKDRDFRWVSANENFLQDLGLSLEEIVGKEDYDLFPEELADKYRADDRRIMETGATEEMEERYAHDGRMTWVHTVKTPVRGPDGEITGVFGIFWDVTERREAGLALRASEERLTYITSSMGDWVWETDENGAYTYSSQKSLDLLGVPPEDVIGKTPFDFMPPAEAERVAVRFSEIVARKAPIVDLENWNSRANGRGVCLLTNAFPILDEAGNLRGYRGVDRDITRRKEDGRLRRLSAMVLGILNEPIPFTDAVQRTFATIKRKIGLDAVGMRLQDGDDFPYFSQDGFSDEFVQAENALAERDASGDVCRDAHGNICLECTCGLVISGKADLTNPLFTSGGSFCANDSSLLLQLPPDQDPRRNPRSRCFHDGYASVALIPIRANQKIVGLLHLNDRRKGRFSRRLIKAFEGICTSIGMALMRKRAAEQIRRQQYSLEKAQELGQIGSWELDLRQNELHWSDENCRIFGVAAGSVVDYETFLGKVHPDDRGYVDREWKAALDGQPYDIEHRLVIDGTVRWVREKADVEFDEEGKAVGGHGFAQDITESKRAEEKLRASDELLNKLSAQIPGVIYQYQYFPGGHSCFPFASQGIWDTYEVTPLEVRDDGVKVFERIHLADRDRVIQSILDSRDHLTQWACDFRVELPAKGVRWLRGASNPQKQEDGSVLWHGYATAITEQKQMEAEREKLQGQLQQARKMDAIGQLAGGVAHDFNNMLEVILGNTEMAMDDVDSTQPLYADLQEVLKAARRSAVLTRQLLTFAREQAISPEIVDLNETVEGMLKMLRRLIGENIDLGWQPREGLWPVMLDPSQIDQILANLCVNARDAIEDVGAITIRLDNAVLDETTSSGQIRPAPGEYVVLSVSDNGCGMDEETTARIFEPFFTTKEMGKGTGMGLATVYGIVQQNGGGIDICSEPGLGTTFAVYLPRHVGAAPAVTGEAAAPAPRGTETILVVEDEVAILKMAKKMLEAQGYTVLAAASPGEAASLFAAHTGEIDLLMTDVIMPEMNGRDLATQLLAIRPDLKCLFMSGYTADVIARHGVLDEGIHFIHKPFSIKDLGSKIREVLEENQGG